MERCHYAIHEKTGKGNDFLGWVDLPVNYDKEEFDRIKKAAARIQANSEVLIVIGIGGSYLGARTALDFIKTPFYNERKKDTPDIYFVGNNISSAYLNDVLAIWETGIFPSTSFPNPAQPQSLRLPFAFSSSFWRKNTERQKPQNVFLPQPTAQRAH